MSRGLKRRGPLRTPGTPYFPSHYPSRIPSGKRTELTQGSKPDFMKDERLAEDGEAFSSSHPPPDPPARPLLLQGIAHQLTSSQFTPSLLIDHCILAPKATASEIKGNQPGAPTRHPSVNIHYPRRGPTHGTWVLCRLQASSLHVPQPQPLDGPPIIPGLALSTRLGRETSGSLRGCVLVRLLADNLGLLPSGVVVVPPGGQGHSER